MQDGLAHYLHFLMPKQAGFVTVSELTAIETALGNSKFSGGSWMVPLAPGGDFFTTYHVDYVNVFMDNMAPKIHTVSANRISKDVFELTLIHPIRFNRTGKVRRRYVGNKFDHHDFQFDFVEVDFLPGVLDELFKQTQHMIIGCQPFFHYRERIEEKNDLLSQIANLAKE